jgi:crotonobetainyl-CoA:carnitine CoA-transferase CaiB-like acyl-CoA transferase
MGDHVTGITLLSGILAKLLERERTGVGGLVATSLMRTGMYTIGWDIGIVLRFGKRESTRPRERSRGPLVNCYRSGDGRAFWLLLLEADRHWPKLVAALGLAGLADDERFTDAKQRLANSEALIAELDEAFARFPYDDLIARFDVIDDPQAQANGAFVDMTPQPGEEPYRAVNGPVDFEGHSVRPGPVPRLGEHTAEVLAELDG